MYSLTWYILSVLSGARLFNFQSSLLYPSFQRFPWISLAITRIFWFPSFPSFLALVLQISANYSSPFSIGFVEYPYKKARKFLGNPWKISEKSKDFQKLGKGAKIEGFLGYIPRNPRKLGFHESVILFNNIQGFPWKAWKLMIQAFHVFHAFLGNCVLSFQAFQGNPWILLNKITLS